MYFLHVPGDIIVELLDDKRVAAEDRVIALVVLHEGNYAKHPALSLAHNT